MRLWYVILYCKTVESVLTDRQFLSFYKFARRFIFIVFVFTVVVILPITYSYTGRYGYPWDGAPGHPDDDEEEWTHRGKGEARSDPLYLWIYVLFCYVFTGIAINMLLGFTSRIIRIRQRYLGEQTTMTDRTFHLSGIPPEMRNEEKVKKFVEELEIGKVERVMVCKDWSELDKLMDKRKKTLQRLEEAWTKHLGYRYDASDPALPLLRPTDAIGASLNLEEDDERTQLLSQEDSNRQHVTDYERARPKTWILTGSWSKLRIKRVDAIDYYDEQLTELDERIEYLRTQDFPPVSLAFVTMTTTASCQMAVQAILDPSPMELDARLAPAPADVVWRNTYLSRTSRTLRTWSITLLIGGLTVFWSALLIPLAYLLDLETLEKMIPGLADTLAYHPVLTSLVQTGLPTLTLSLLTIAVPFFYNWLANFQGMTSQGEVELSVISKNFFFIFFNLFLIFTLFATATKFYGLWENLRDLFKDTTMIAFALARSLEALAPFYTNLIVLQGLGLFPFRLLEFGAVFLYPFQRLGASTPRDYASLGKPPNFSYGLALPQGILVFVICISYSVFPSSWLVCMFGLLYFTIGGFIYKYQVLYAMDHSQHSTGRAWPMIGSRIILGLLLFQLATIGSLALRTAIVRSVLILPLLAFTIWFSYFYARTYDPLMKFIALRSIDRSRPPETDSSDDLDADLDADIFSPVPSVRVGGGGTGVGGLARNAAERGGGDPEALASPPSRLDRDSVPMRVGGRDIRPRLRKYVNPNLVVPLDQAWIPPVHRQRSGPERRQEGPGV